MEQHGYDSIGRGGDGAGVVARHTTKTLRKRLQRQLEFYLSESNLRQDKFLQQHMDEHGFLAIDLFLSFNKVKSMGVTAKMVREAMEKSTLVRVSADGSAIAPIELPFDKEDTSAERTLYIENFAVEDDHDSLRKRLSMFGKVNFVSMPRFPQSKRFKGFAFVEFGSVEVAERAAKAALAHDPKLQGMRAMPKTEWLEMKRQLKEQLAAAAEHAVNNTSAVAAVSGEDVELLDSAEPERMAHAVPCQPVDTRRAKKKRKGGHIRFGADDDSGCDDDGDGGGSADNDDSSKCKSSSSSSLVSAADAHSGAGSMSKKQKAH